MRQPRLTRTKKAAGFTLIEILIGLVIVLLLLQLVGGIASDYIHKYRIFQNANDIADIPRAVQRRNAHDGFVFSLWDENGGRAATDATITWDEANFDELLSNFLVGRDHPGCGAGANGWNPVNTDGTPDGGDPTGMERTALIGCSDLRGLLPYRVRLSAALSPDNTGVVQMFRMYLNMTDVHFGQKNDPENNILNFTQLKNALANSIDDNLNGIPRVDFGVVGDLADFGDDNDGMTPSECEDALLAGNECSILVTLSFNGVTGGMYKRTDNLNYFIDDVTFGQSIAAGRQRCAYWNDETGAWNAEIVDCAIKAGANDDEVELVVDKSQAQALYITGKDAAGVEISHTCRIFEQGAAGEELLTDTGNTSPCGIMSDGTIVQLLAETAHIGTARVDEVVARTVNAASTTLYSTAAGDTVLQVFDAAHNGVTFSIDNEGNAVVGGTLGVVGEATFNSNATVMGDFFADRNATFNMNNNSRVTMGATGTQLTMDRPDGQTFRISSNGVNFQILTGNNQGVEMTTAASGETEIKFDAGEGVVGVNGTEFHSAISSLTGEEYSNISQTDAEKLRSRLVTADMARYLDDTSSNIQIVGIDRVEGEFTTLNKPDCLAFADDSNFSSPEANPYRNLAGGNDITGIDGKTLARLVLLPMYMKTYNSAFGDNQIFAQHASHASADTWEIFLYLSGEGAFSTGAREDGAGGSLAMTLCDYSSINFSGQTF